MTQDYTAPDGNSYSRHGILARVRVEDYETGTVRPHERTHPGPLLDRLELTRATLHNLSPIFSLSTEDAWPLVEPVLAGQPWGVASDEDGTVNRVWRVTDPAILGAVTERLAGAQLLIADGHHRYETARAYRDEVGGEGPHNYTLMSLTGLDDPGLTVFPTHRLLSGFAADPERMRTFGAGLRQLFDNEEVAVGGDRPGRRGRRRRLRPLRLLPPAGLPAAAQGHRRPRPCPGRKTRGLPPPRLGDPRDPRPQRPGRDERPRHRRPQRARVRQERARRARDGRRRRLRRSPSSSARYLSSRSRRSPKPTRTCRRSRPTSSPR